MKAETYKLFDHRKHIALMLQKRDMPLNTIMSLPEFGAIVIEDHRPIAAGFLRFLEGHMAIFDSFITNPDFGSLERDEGLNHITQFLLDLGRDLGLAKLLVFSSWKSLTDRSLTFGFKPEHYECSSYVYSEET